MRQTHILYSAADSCGSRASLHDLGKTKVNQANAIGVAVQQNVLKLEITENNVVLVQV